MLLSILVFKYFATAQDFAFEFELILNINKESCICASGELLLAHRTSCAQAFFDTALAEDMLAPIAHGQLLDDAETNAADILFGSFLVVSDGILGRVLHLSDCLFFGVFNFFLYLFDEVYCLDFSLTT